MVGLIRSLRSEIKLLLFMRFVFHMGSKIEHDTCIARARARAVSFCVKVAYGFGEAVRK